jgi:hypothetical protein
MEFGDRRYVEDMTAGRRQLRICVLAVEPVADIAVLETLDPQVSKDFYNAATVFDRFCDDTEPVQIFTADIPPTGQLPVYILTHTRKWVSGLARRPGLELPSLTIESKSGISGGTSGGPVVTEDDGLLVGVVSTAGGPVDKPSTRLTAPRVYVAAPRWLIRRMVDPDGEMREVRDWLKKHSTK